MTNTGSDESGWQYVLQVAAHLALPVLALVMLQAGSLTRYVRASMLDVVKWILSVPPVPRGCRSAR